MRRFLKIAFCISVVLLFCKKCIYRKITHMTEDDLEWVTNRYIGEVARFTTVKGDSATCIIKKIVIHNSLNPINFSHDSCEEYIAYANIDYVVYQAQDSLTGSLTIQKVSNGQPVMLSARLGSRYACEQKIDFGSYHTIIGSISDCIWFGKHNTKLEKNDDKSSAVHFFYWSKKYGLFVYGFKDEPSYLRDWGVKRSIECKNTR